MAVVKINPKGLNNNETAQFLEDGAFDRSLWRFLVSSPIQPTHQPSQYSRDFYFTD